MELLQAISEEIQRRKALGEASEPVARNPSLPCIYGLYNRDGDLIYIGKANDPYDRVKRHVRDSKRRHTPLMAWIRKHGTPNVKILKQNCVDWKTDEKAFIAAFRAAGIKLLNVADGGDEPMCSHEQRVQNGKNSSAYVKAFHADPERKRIWAAKVQIGMYLRRGWLGERQINLMKQFPHVYGKMLTKAGYM